MVPMDQCHIDPVYKTIWLNAKQGNEFFTGSTDGTVSSKLIHKIIFSKFIYSSALLIGQLQIFFYRQLRFKKSNSQHPRSLGCHHPLITQLSTVLFIHLLQCLYQKHWSVFFGKGSILFKFYKPKKNRSYNKDLKVFAYMYRKSERLRKTY